MQRLLLGRDMCGERREVIGYRLWAIGYRRGYNKRAEFRSLVVSSLTD